ncbi:MAG: response regulator [Treponema sp.]|uniref:response regulator transcription factor n=1 Tax=Treponema sp. TaxID=166 RepID=UPI0025E40E35|nr:response regulator [Treponema sp.]MBQ9280594.1 response regulator [Treponema sp.]
MAKILIVDDEKLIRAGIQKILSGAYKDDVEFLEAKNGSDALELCKTELPDVMITDIRMPVMDGVELMKNVSNLVQKPAIIVLSGFDDFSYAKAAIETGASSYILKPVDSQELLKSVDKALSGILRDIHHKNEEKFRSLINEGHLSEDIAEDIAAFAKNGMYCVSLSSNLCKSAPFDFLDGITHYVIEQKRGFMSFIVSKDLLEKVISHPSLTDCCAMGISLPSTTVSDLRHLRRQSFCALLQKFFADEQRGVFRYPAGKDSPDLTDFDVSYEKIIANLDLLNEEEVRKSVQKFLDFDMIESDNPEEFLYYAYNKITTGLFARYPKFTSGENYLYSKSLMIENILSVASLKEWKVYVLDYILYLLEILKNRQGKYPYITTAVQYIREHYSQDITMAIVANHVSMNYTWFSEKFKEQMGVNFNDYLKRFRMEQAKHLLEKGTFKVYEVAEKCGFKDVKHFMKSFRDLNGMSAGEYGRLYSRERM